MATCPETAPAEHVPPVSGPGQLVAAASCIPSTTLPSLRNEISRSIFMTGSDNEARLDPEQIRERNYEGIIMQEGAMSHPSA